MSTYSRFLSALAAIVVLFAVEGRVASALGEVYCADLEIIKTASSDRVQVGERLTYFLTVANRGPEDAYDVEVFDAFPDEFSVERVISPSGWSSSLLFDVLRSEIPVLYAGESAVFEIRVEALRARDQVVNEARISSNTTECDNKNNVDQVTVRIHAPSDPSVPTLSEIGLALFALLMGATLFVFARRQ